MKEKNKKIKILYLITKSNWGGAQVYVHSLATSLPQENYDVKIINGGDGILNKKLRENNIEIINIKGLDRDIHIFDEIKVFFKILKIFIKEKPNIIHLNSSKIAGLGAVAGRIARVKNIIFTAHGWPFNEDRPLWQKFLIIISSYATVLFSHKTIVIAEKELKQTKNWPFVSKKIHLIYNGIPKIDYLKQKEAREFLSKKIPMEINKNTIWTGTISELTKNKGLEYTIKAIKIIKKNFGDDWNGIFVIIGEGEDKERLEEIIKKERLENNIILIGFVENASQYLKAFDMFILSSIKEGFPYALLEAGQAGNAIISTRVGGTEEIINNLENGILIHPKREKEIYNGINFYLRDKEKMSDFGKKIKIRIKNKFNLKKMVEKTSMLYLLFFILL
jgi:glycosyltransferase involved in cell wall biosynthesis